MSKIHEAVEQALIDALYWIEERENLVRMVQTRLQDQYHGDNNISDATSTLAMAMYKRESGAWQRAMMFGLGLPKGSREKLKAAAHTRFLGGGAGGARQSVMHLLERDGDIPGRYLVKDEEALREEIRKWLEGDEA